MRALLLVVLAAGCRTAPFGLADGGVDQAPPSGITCSTDGTVACGAPAICCWTYTPASGACTVPAACNADVEAPCTRASDCPGQVCCFHFLNRRTQFTDCLSPAACAAQQGEPLCPSSACADRDCCSPIGPAGSKVCTPGGCA